MKDTFVCHSNSDVIYPVDQLNRSFNFVILMVSVPLLWPALFAAFFLSVTFSWDEFIIAFLVSRFDVTLPVEIWSMLRTGLNPKTNAIGSFVFLVSVVVVRAADLILFRKKKA